VLKFLDALLWRCPPRPKLLPWWGRRRGRFVQRVRTGRKVKRIPANDVTVLLVSIDVSRIFPARNIMPHQVADVLEASLGIPRASSVSAADAAGSYRLELAVTEMRPAAWWAQDDPTVPVEALGSPWPWLFFVFVGTSGLGHAWLQVEGRLWGEDKRRPVLEFSHRIRRSRFEAVEQEIDGPGTHLQAICIAAARCILWEIHTTVAA
jgi:hypothetical protein